MTADVAFVISDLGSGGAQRVLTTLANSWARAGRKICIITFSTPENDFFPLEPTIHRIVIDGMSASSNPFSAVFFNLKRIIRIRRAIKKSGAPIVVGFVGSTNVLVIFAAIGLHLRVVISERNDPARQSLGTLWDFLRRHVYRYADVVTANTRGALETLAKFVPSAKLALVPNLLSIPELNQASQKRSALLAVGRLSHQKAYDILLAAFAEVSSHFPHWRLEIVGEGELRENLKEMANQLGISQNVIWRGHQSNPFVFYRKTEIFVLASRYEGMPNAMLEAMVCGMPVIVTDASPGPLEYVKHEKTGLVVPVENVQLLSDAMMRLIRDTDLRKRLGQAGKERVAECEIRHGLPVWEHVLGLPTISISKMD
ncbi:MAG: glycosyltransferase family 4 protein [Candidatus Omnitrophota bacterium]|jgi:glycosyltransferase involved in cell wall biosynthesis|nr:MAG: glycosyltransferase family 4 protein [Candidatus Omnitrophota bacterium]